MNGAVVDAATDVSYQPALLLYYKAAVLYNDNNYISLVTLSKILIQNIYIYISECYYLTA